MPALVPVPAAVLTAILPVPAPCGTAAVIRLADTIVNTALLPLNVTRSAPLKFAPSIVTRVPVGPLVGVKLEMLGATNGVTL